MSRRKHLRCSFFGHYEDEISEEKKLKIKEKIVELINDGFDIFMIGNKGTFTDICYQIITDLQKIYPHVKRIICMYSPWEDLEIKRPKEFPYPEYEKIIYLSPAYQEQRSKTIYRNQETVDISDYVIFYVQDRPMSRTYETLEYAINFDIPHCNLSE